MNCHKLLSAVKYCPVLPYNALYCLVLPSIDQYFRHIDSNCNGIYGVNPISGRGWEEELCSGSGEKGIIYIG